MELWFIGALVAALVYGLHNIFTKLAAGKVSDSLGGIILEGTAALLILVYILYLGKKGVKVWNFNSYGLLFSVLAGICVGIGTVLYFMIFRSGGNLSIAGPLVLVGGVLLMALVGMIFFKEKVSALKIFGLTLGMVSLWILKMSS